MVQYFKRITTILIKKNHSRKVNRLVKILLTLREYQISLSKYYLPVVNLLIFPSYLLSKYEGYLGYLEYQISLILNIITVKG